MELQRKKLFNVDGDDSLNSQAIIGGNPTGILNLNNIKYKWVSGMYRVMTGDFWIPERVSMTEDKLSIKSLTPAEDEAVQNTLAFLIFLDSLQVSNLPNIADYITNSGVSNLIGIQQFQEIIHSQSYQYILDALYPSGVRNDVYDKWRTNPQLLERNQWIADQYQMFIESPTENNFFRVLIANFLLEGIYFYSGFNMFEQLASRQKLQQSASIIKYIKTDENNHLTLFLNIIKEVMDVQEHKDWITESVMTAVEHEIMWAKSAYGDRILGISEQSSEQFIKYLGNKRLKMLRLPEVYGDVENPYIHLELADSKRENFFEGSVTSYSRSEAVDGWDF